MVKSIKYKTIPLYFFNFKSENIILFGFKIVKRFRIKNENLFYEAIEKDFGKSKFDTFTTEISFILKDKILVIF
jgi:hypothetical protein